MIHILSGIILTIILLFLSFKFDNNKFKDYINSFNLTLNNEKLTKLINADPIENLPNLIVNTNNTELIKNRNCTNNPIFLSSVDESSLNYKDVCENLCGSSATIIKITDNDEYYQNSKKLPTGNYCNVGSMDCNLKTGYVVSSGIGGVVCRSKFPNMFGGENASTIIACNDEKYPATGSVLWDNLYNTQVDPTMIIMNSEDELLVDGSFRFSCKYNYDANKNPIKEHPANRFHPIMDPCLLNLYSTSLDAGVRVKENEWYCDCNVERLYNTIKGDLKSPCTTCNNSTEVNKNLTIKTIRYDCFTVNSKLNSVESLVPCNPNNFTNLGEMCDVVNLSFLNDTNPFSVPVVVHSEIKV